LPNNFSFDRQNFIKIYFWSRINTIAKYILPESVKKIVRKKRELILFKKHPLQWYGIHEASYVSKLIRNGATNINSTLVLDYIRNIPKNIRVLEIE